VTQAKPTLRRGFDWNHLQVEIDMYQTDRNIPRSPWPVVLALVLDLVAFALLARAVMA